MKNNIKGTVIVISSDPPNLKNGINDSQRYPLTVTDFKIKKLKGLKGIVVKRVNSLNYVNIAFNLEMDVKELKK